MAKRVSITEVAQRAQVSVTAVSRALKGEGGVSQGTREKIVQIANELGYRPKHSSSYLKKTALLMAYRPHPTDSYYFREVYSGLVDGLYSAGIVVVFIPMMGSLKDQILVRQLQLERIETAVLLYQEDDQLAGLLAEGGIKCIALPSVAGNSGQAVIDYDNVGGTEMLLKHLATLGHKAIGLIYAHPELKHHGERIEIYRNFVNQQSGGSADYMEVRARSGTTEDGKYAALQLFQQHPRCTAIFAINDRLALGVCQAAQQMGRQIPQEVAVAGFDDTDMASYFSPKLTTVHVPYYDMSARAASLIVGYFQTGKLPRERIVEPTQLIIRESSWLANNAQ